MNDAQPPYDDDELLKIVGDERKRSIGFGEGDNGDLRAARDKALSYAKGEMTDLPSLPNRSSVTDTAIADAVETVLPDVMEVFVGGEDVATFAPTGEQDETAAQEESEFVHHVVFTQNEGFLTLYTAIKDALLTRTGIIHWWWEDEETTETVAEVPEAMAQLAVAAAPQMIGHEVEAGEAEDGKVALTTNRKRGKVRIRAFPSEDFTVAPDTVSLRDATYCAVRDRPRVQDLIARGIDAEKARALKPYAKPDETIEQDRDRAGESQHTSGEGMDDLRTVEIRDHYIRLLHDGKLCIWRVTTDAEETVLLDSEECAQVPFAALTPYITPHRFYGESVADKLIQVQQIKTVLLRNHLDSIYFALNQRMEVDMSAADEFTISDLLRNEPGVPIRVKRAGAINAVAAGALNVDTLASLEYASTLAESRSGIVRNAQGLNPDTLHDTAKGALALIGAAQKRVRMIARIFAETGIKDLFVGVHALLRRGYTDEHEAPSFKRGKAWKEVKPQGWQERQAMTVHVGVGSAGREHDLMIAAQRLELAKAVIETGAADGLLDPMNVYNQLMAYERAAGSKNGDRFWSNPEGKEPQQPQPDPKMAEVQGKLQMQQVEMQGQLQLAHAKAGSELQLQARKHEMDAQAAEVQAQRDHEHRMAEAAQKGETERWQVSQELALKREIAFAELELKREIGMAQAHSQHQVGMAKVDASVREPQTGGEPG